MSETTDLRKKQGFVWHIHPLRHTDAPAFQALLAAMDLPPASVDSANATYWCVSSVSPTYQDAMVHGGIGLERYDDGGLLRSLVVDAACRGHGIGAALVDVVLGAAADLPAVYLLTTTAADYFVHLGFVPCTREDVPLSVRAADEFTSVCPSTAQVLVKYQR